MDEAGAGRGRPVVAAAVVFPTEMDSARPARRLLEINDSKQLSARMREIFTPGWFPARRSVSASPWVDAPLIDQVNILQATHRAMNLALAKLDPPPRHVLVDGLRVKTLEFRKSPSCPAMP